MKKEKISWDSDGLRIVGELYLPQSRKKVPGLIICHGIPAKVKGPEDRGYPLLAERFCRETFGVIIFNFRGAGASEGNFDILGWARDLERGLDYALSLPNLDNKKLYVMGFSGGAAVSIYVAAHRQEIRALVSCASPAEFRDLVTRPGLDDFLKHAREVGIIKDADFPTSMEEWKGNFRTVEPLNWIDRIPPRPLLLLQGTQDDVVDQSHAKRLYAKVAGKAELFLIEGGGHRLRVEEKAMEKAMEWLKKLAFGGTGKGFRTP